MNQPHSMNFDVKQLFQLPLTIATDFKNITYKKIVLKYKSLANGMNGNEQYASSKSNVMWNEDATFRT